MPEVRVVKFRWPDYVAFAATQVLPVLLGLIIALCRRRKRKERETSDTYVRATESFNPFPVGVSILASVLNSAFFLGVPAEIYFNGTTYMFVVLGVVIATILAAHVFVPFYFKLKPTSIYEVRIRPVIWCQNLNFPPKKPQNKPKK